jgi:hypothetical protein|tara:strand:- start:427 stop:615 length:189 start_codon:yes stop_codon:yes gene_type:complete
MLQLCYESKKELKANIGNELDYIETSMFGEEYKSTGTITGCNKKRSWFANVTIEDNKITRVK